MNGCELGSNSILGMLECMLCKSESQSAFKSQPPGA